MQVFVASTITSLNMPDQSLPLTSGYLRWEQWQTLHVLVHSTFMEENYCIILTQICNRKSL